MPGAGKGSVTFSTVPFFGADSICTVPLSSEARSRMPSRPRELSSSLSSTARGSNPIPSSSTSTVTSSGWRTSSTLTRVAWAWRTQRHADGSPRPLFVAGHSAGAVNAALIALDDRYLAAEGVPGDAVTGFIGLAGPYVDVTRIFPSVFPYEGRARFEPVNAVDAGDPPMLLVQSDADEIVSITSLSGLAAAARAAGVDVTTLTPPARSHVDVFRDMLEPDNPVRTAIDTFVARFSTP